MNLEVSRMHAEIFTVIGVTISPLDKETWLRVATEWMRLAQSADQRESKISN
jgi:hypothetical protein